MKLSRLPSVSCAKGCVVHGPWPTALQHHVRVLINPANDSLSGPQRPAFPRGGPVPPPASPGLALMDAANHDLLYPAQAVDGLVHLQGGAALREALIQAAPVIEERPNGEHMRCRVGEAVLTSGVNGVGSDGESGLPYDAIVHTVPPFWPRGDEARDPVARVKWAGAILSCYDAAFAAAIAFAAETRPDAGLAIATPVLGTGARGAPFAPAARALADAAVRRFGGRSGSSTGSSACGAMETSLRVVVHSASLSGEMETIEAALEAALEASGGGMQYS